jgi:NAD(P)-dependent dehydrogenase (short-subunit alcohol dehydrogenase family)
MITANGLRVLISAGAQGIGLAMARAFAEAGAHVHVCDSNQRAIDELGASGLPISASQCDVTDRLGVERMFASALEHLGGLDTLINNAGIPGPTGRVDEIAPNEWDRTLAVNITGQYNLARLAVPELIKSERASIICISSAAGRLAFPKRSAYAASKWAVVGFVKTLASELGELGIRVNAILPGMVDGPRIQGVIEAKAKAAGQSSGEILEQGLAGMSVKRMVDPHEVAAAAMFLASDGARAISGEAIGVDNGLRYMV